MRKPLADAESELKAIETEARTLQRILNQGAQDLFPAIVERIKVERGYETALGAALGEDLDAPLDPSAPAHWSLVPGDGRCGATGGHQVACRRGFRTARTCPQACRRRASSPLPKADGSSRC